MPSSAASSTASGSHGASTTRSVRRDIHCTATSPTARRADDRARRQPPRCASERHRQRDARRPSRRAPALRRAAPATESCAAGSGRHGSWRAPVDACAAGREAVQSTAGVGARRGVAVSVTIGNCQRGSATESTGSTSALVSASVQTRWRTAAEARPSTSEARPAGPRRSVALRRASTAGSQSAVEPVRNAGIQRQDVMARLRSGGPR